MSKTKEPQEYYVKEVFTPEKARLLLQRNHVNRKLSKGNVRAYSEDMSNENWNARNGESIKIDKDGNLVDGQHRLKAIVLSGKTVKLWCLKNAPKDAVYDSGRKRSLSDQISILKPEQEKIYSSTLFISVATYLITPDRRKVTTNEVVDFTEKHKEDLDGYWLELPFKTVARISVSDVHIGLFLAYCNGVSIDTIKDFYEILSTGMSTGKKDFPAVALRNYLLESPATNQERNERIKRCQYALSNYIKDSGTKQNRSPADFIWAVPERFRK
ncbi:MAG: hypothetical protein IKO30_09025 [Lachnospiraceae bacterium]|nr:hypothetical protein [Lachnospiraceae bacterium]